jgi:hypothetical protein
MNEHPPRRYWPYDEVTAAREGPAKFSLSTPWIKTKVEVEDSEAELVAGIAAKIASGSLSAEDAPGLTWLFASLDHFPLAYILPESSDAPADSHRITGSTLDCTSPLALAQQLAKELHLEEKVSSLFSAYTADWKWDADSALAFSANPRGHDPLALFSVARRFHLLEAVEKNQTEALDAFVRDLPREAFQKALALMVRQNHYVTQQCDRALRPALALAARAAPKLEEFLRAEAGHDKILKKALKLMGVEPESVPVIPSIFFLMELFHYVAGRNFLAFSLVVDMFERSSYQSQDPLAQLLAHGGMHEAARQVDVHREINDAGAHENVAAGFLSQMGAVDAAYAREALYLCEMITQTVHMVSAEQLEIARRG